MYLKSALSNKIKGLWPTFFTNRTKLLFSFKFYKMKVRIFTDNINAKIWFDDFITKIK